MKYNNETSMEPHLQEEIQMLLSLITIGCGTSEEAKRAVYKLSGICAALHALTGEQWMPRWNFKRQYILVSEDGTECITPGEL